MTPGILLSPFLRAFAGGFKLAQSSGVRRVRLSLDLAVLVDQSSERRRPMASTCLRGNDRFAKAVIHVVDQKPRAPI
ncbi:MAG: hypothetical protein WA709_35690 [Stellaceae bacterium]